MTRSLSVLQRLLLHYLREMEAHAWVSQPPLSINKYTEKRLKFCKDNLDGHFINSMNIDIWAVIMTLTTYTKQDIK